MRSSKPHIVHVYKDYYPPVRGGIESTINLLARGCVDEFRVSVVVCAGSGTPGTEWIDGVEVLRVPEWGRLWSAPIAPRFVETLRQIARSADLLHFHHPNPTGDLAFLLAKIRRPYVITYHSDVVRQRAAMFVYGPIQERMMRGASLILATSPQYVESSAWLRRFRHKCRVVPLGISLERFRETALVLERARQVRAELGTPLVVFVGRLRYYKGLHFLIEAMRGVDGVLAIIGSGPMLPRLIEEAQRRGVTQRVHFLGDLSDEEVVAHLYAADVFCLPSHLRSEAFGICQIEAMACGVPVVSTALDTGVPFVNLHGETGLVVPPADPAALARALETLLTNSQLRQQLGRAARQRAHAVFSAEQMCRNVKAIYRDILERPS